MTGTVIEAAVRRALTVTATTATLLVVGALLAGPASAEVPVGWGPQEPVDKMHVLFVLIGIPVALFVIIAAVVYLPDLMRGERVAPGATGPHDQWLGGRRNAGELEAAPAGGSPAGTDGDVKVLETDGGASARW